jgi:hypothetical protein
MFTEVTSRKTENEMEEDGRELTVQKFVLCIHSNKNS